MVSHLFRSPKALKKTKNKTKHYNPFEKRNFNFENSLSLTT